MKDEERGRDWPGILLFIASVGVGTSIGFVVADLMGVGRVLTVLLTAVGSGVMAGMLFTLARLLR
jgi:hypothetical protein